jgi:hypothetical protein
MSVFEKINSGQSSSSSGGVFSNIKKKEDTSNKKTIVEGQKKFGKPTLDPSQSPVMKQATKFVKDNPPAPTNYETRKDLPSRKIPVIGGVFKALDKFSDSKVQHVIADVGQTLYTPGAGLANVAKLTGAAENLVSRALPSVGRTVGGAIAKKAASEAIVGAPLGVAQSLAQGQDNGEALKGGLYGAALGGVTGGAFGALGESLNRFKPKTIPDYSNVKLSEGVGINNPIKPPINDIKQILGDTAIPTAASGKFNYTPDELNFIKSHVDNPYIDVNKVEIPKEYQGKDILYRRDNANINLSDKPHGAYFSYLNDGKSLYTSHFDAGGTDHWFVPNFKNTLDVKPNVVETNARAGSKKLETSAGVQAALDLSENPDILHYSKDNLEILIKDLDPSLDLSKYHDNWELLEVYGAQLAKEHGYDSISLRVPDDPASSEVVALKNDAFKRIETHGKLLNSHELALKETAATQSAPLGTRANYKNQLDNGNLSPELKQKINNTDQTYEKVTNQGSLDKANESVKNLPKAESDFLLNESGGADHIANGYRLMQKLDALGEHERALIVSDKLAKDLTTSGQTSQAASILSRLSPEGQLLNLVRQASKNGKTVSLNDSVEFKAQAKIVQEKSGAGIQANQFTEILDRAAKGEVLGAEDIKKMSDYLASAEKNVAPKAVKVVDELPHEFKDVRKRDKIVSYLDDVEQAALARIAKRKNNLNSLPVSEWADHAIVVSSQIAKGSIKAATHIEDMVKLFGEEIRPVATQVFQKAQSLLKSVSPGVGSNDMNKANEAFKRISGQSNVNLQEKIVEKYVKDNSKISPKDINTLRELAKNVTRLSGDARVDADIAMQKILNSYEKSSVWDKALALRYMSMLLNTSTQAINAASGPIMATTGHVADVFGTMLDVSMHAVLKTPRSTTLYGSNPLSFMARYLKGLKVGTKAGAQGVNPAGIQSTNEIRGLAFKSLKNPFGLAERALGAVSKGPDFAAYSAVYKSEMEKQGFLSAINSGIKRSDKKDIKAHIENFINEPTEEAMLQADRIGKNTTFQRSDSTGGKVANHLNNAPTLVKPFVNAVVPFVRTPINMASSAVTMTPAGIIKGLFQLTSKSKASQREAIRTLSLGITGSGISAVGYYLFNLGIITGANDSGDKDVDAIREQAGKGKYRFNQSGLMRYLSAMLDGEGSDAAEKAAKYQEGDHAFDYNKLQPLAFPLAIGASLGQNKAKPIAGKLGSAGSDAYGSLFGMSTLKGVQDVFQPQYGGTQGEKSLGVASRVAESFFKSFSPGGLAQEARRQDPIVRKTPYNNGIKEDVKGYFKSRTPGQSQSLPANKTTLGMNKMNAPGFSGQYANPYKSEVAAYSGAAVIISDLIDKTGDASLAPSAPEKKVEGKNRAGDQVTIAIPQDRYEQLQEEVGHNIILKIAAISTSLTDAKKAEKIKEIYKTVRKKEMDKVKRELGIRVSN